MKMTPEKAAKHYAKKVLDSLKPHLKKMKEEEELKAKAKIESYIMKAFAKTQPEPPSE